MKLKKLNLCGFKSFADRTEFDFDDGISCVVGPNGCGKSNIVDAVKWVLGEQSAKSLRGSEMMDVIFNGSAGRRPAGMAEVTLVFDNTQGLLRPPGQDEPAAEISVTRRLFRDGLSEYLINKEQARLRDIREMFMDTGIGTDAYSLIEQGKVEAFLQADQEDRRAIFDEAAGISKYKARKREALRKLERVEQNLLRLNDIFGEVEKRLRSIKYQAGKARSYQTYSQRLKELKSLHLLAQYHNLHLQRKDLQHKLDAAADALSVVNTRIEQLEAAASGTEVELVDVDRSHRQASAEIAAIDSQIVAAQQRIQMLTQRIKELSDQTIRQAGRCEQLEAKAQQLDEEIAAKTTGLDRLSVHISQATGQYDQTLTERDQGELQLSALRARLDDEKAGMIDLLRQTAHLHNDIQAAQIRRENLSNQSSRLAGRTCQIDQLLCGLLDEQAGCQARLSDIRELIDQAQSRLDQSRQAHHQLADDQVRLQAQIGQLREQRSAMVSRISTLREMLLRWEGVSGGTRNILEAWRRGELSGFKGLLGDLLEADLEHAGLVESALAGADQYLLVERRRDALIQAEKLKQLAGSNGAVDILCMDSMVGLSGDFDAGGCPQILGRLIDRVRCEADLAPLMWRMLGNVFVVRTLDDAIQAEANCPAGARFVTQAGDVVEADGRIRLASANRGSGVISRRSELTQLDAQQLKLTERIDELTGKDQGMRGELTSIDATIQQLRAALDESNTERVECESRGDRLGDQVQQLEKEKALIAQDLAILLQDIEAAVSAEQQAKHQAGEVEAINVQRQQAIEGLLARIAQAGADQAELAAKLTELKVTLAELGEKSRSIGEAIAGLRRHREQVGLDLLTGKREIELNHQRRSEAQQGCSEAQGQIEQLYRRHELLGVQLRDLEETRSGLAGKLEQIRTELVQQRKEHDQAGQHQSAVRLELGEVDVRIEGLLGRSCEEMGMNLPESYASYQHDEGRDWGAVAAEIQDLRDKIERLGNVNLDAISEQEDLEKRGEFLRSQLSDITDSRDRLGELVRRINKESRQLFIDTFEAIRTNFQELFRKLFNGGRADILLADSDNVLECGIEIVARPPGKELRSLSLLSGGEKTMTALALLFSIFKTRPSPFCLLDEVDAALDEANTDRFTRLVGEFVDTSQFLIISHAKRTMSMANVLYGVTMHEPGVSQRISVRFEDAHHRLEGQKSPLVQTASV